MNPGTESFTAIVAAVIRAHHFDHDHPKVFEDPVAGLLVLSEERVHVEEWLAAQLPRLAPEVDTSQLDQAGRVCLTVRRRAGTSEILARARFAEERLAEAVARGLRQYVILGAGLDTFAFRRRDLLASLAVFEVDHPATQAAKRERLSRAGLVPPAGLHFVPVDFEVESVAEGLRRSPYDPGLPAFFSWLGVAFYLSKTAVIETLRSVRSVAAPGTEVVFDHVDRDALDPARAAPRVRLALEAVRGLGEAFVSGLDPSELASLLAEVGFELVEQLGPEEQQVRYFWGRGDGLYSMEHAHLVRARVAPA